MLVKFILWLISHTDSKQFNQIMTAYRAACWIEDNVLKEHVLDMHTKDIQIDTLRREVKRLEREAENFLKSPVPMPIPPRTHEVFTRMDQEVYDYFEKSVQANCLVTSTTSDIEAGFKLGVSHVLSKLRAGYVIQKSN